MSSTSSQLCIVMLPQTKYTPKPNFHSKFKEGKKPWKNDSYTKENKGGPSKEDLRRKNLCLHANNLGSQDIDMQRGRHATFEFFLKMMKRRRRRKRNILQPKKRGIK